MTAPGQDVLAQRCRRQAGWCAGEGEELYAQLLERVANDLEVGGPCWQVLAPYAHEPGENAVALRFLAAVHALVLAGQAPSLARFYGSAGSGEGGRPAEAWPAFLATVEAAAVRLREATALPCQTNEVGRSAALLPALLAVVQAAPRPVRLLEVGCSAGLNLRLDRYWYGGWGDPASPVRLEGLYDAGPPPAAGPALKVVERAGSDLRPIDATTEAGALRLASFTWPSQRERLARLRGAVEVARAVPARIDQADAVEWVTERLGERPRRVLTVVMHSVFVQYLPPPRREALVHAIERAGRQAGSDAPLAWVRMEPGKAAFEVRAALFPPGRDVLVGTCGPHGASFSAA